MPSPSGRRTSVITMSTAPLGEDRRRPRRGSPPSRPRSPPWRSMMASISRMDGSSSTTRIRLTGQDASRRPARAATAEAQHRAGAPRPRSRAGPLRTRDVAAVLAHDAVDDGEAQAGAHGRPGLEGLEDAPLLVPAHAAPLVPHATARSSSPSRRSSDAQHAARRGMASRPLRARFQKTWVIWSRSARQTCGPSSRLELHRVVRLRPRGRCAGG